MESSIILKTEPSQDYELIDSGDGEKLERFGNVVLVRPDPQAIWNKKASEEKWSAATAKFVQSSKAGRWVFGQPKSDSADSINDWSIKIGQINFMLGLSSFKHTGIFPEQSPNWDWIIETIKSASANGAKISVLNLFGYTGGASLAAAMAGAEVCHVDGSKVSIARAKKNAEISGLSSAPIRFILDDALAFVEREARRGKYYDAIIMDPPAFGRGPDGEVWKIEKSLPKLMEACKKILSPNPLFVLINGYAAGYSPVAYVNILSSLISGSSISGDQSSDQATAQSSEKIEFGELAIMESNKDSVAGRLLPAGIFARFRRNRA